MSKPNIGNIVDNGFFKIQLIETPRWNDERGRWFARGYRWLKTRQCWEAKPKLYGWDNYHHVAIKDN